MTFDKMYNDKNNREFISKFAMKKFLVSQLPKVMEFDDFHNICLTHIYKHIEKFDGTKSKITTYLSRMIVSMLITEVRKLHTGNNNIMLNDNSNSLDNLEISRTIEGTYLIDNSEIEDNILYGNVEEVCKNIFKKELSDIQKSIVELRLKGYNWNEISKKLNCSKTNISYHKKQLELSL